MRLATCYASSKADSNKSLLICNLVAKTPSLIRFTCDWSWPSDKILRLRRGVPGQRAVQSDLQSSLDEGWPCLGF